MRFDLYRAIEDEQTTWERLHAETRQRSGLEDQITPDVVDHLVSTYKRFPWLPPGVMVGLARVGADDRSVQLAADQVAQSRFEQKTTAGKTQVWSQPGDTLGG